MGIWMGSSKGVEQRAEFRNALVDALVMDEVEDAETVLGEQSEWLQQYEPRDRSTVVSFLASMSMLVVKSGGSFDDNRLQAIGESMRNFVALLKDEDCARKDFDGMTASLVSLELREKLRVVEAWNEMWYLIIPREDDTTTLEPGREH